MESGYKCAPEYMYGHSVLTNKNLYRSNTHQKVCVSYKYKGSKQVLQLLILIKDNQTSFMRNNNR